VAELPNCEKKFNGQNHFYYGQKNSELKRTNICTVLQTERLSDYLYSYVSGHCRCQWFLDLLKRKRQCVTTDSYVAGLNLGKIYGHTKYFQGLYRHVWIPIVFTDC